MPDAPWEFWIDVGGTFTDCIARSAGGQTRACKVLSSGVVKGRIDHINEARRLIDPMRRGDPDGFYNGYRCRLLDADGSTVAEPTVTRFTRADGALTLDQPASGASYELFSDEPAPVLGIRRLLGLRLDQPIGTVKVLLGTTRATNALLERKGAAVALVTTEGFADLLEIGTQARPHLFRLKIEKPPPLYRRAIEIRERINAEGQVLAPVNAAEVEQQLVALRTAGIDSVAICLLNAYRNPAHEDTVAEIAHRLGFVQVSVSSDLSPTIKALDRGATAVVDAYLSPVVRSYIDDLRRHLPDANLRLMTSAAGLIDTAAGRVHGKDLLLSGPAGGVVGMAQAARAAGFDKAIGFDMGGTSTDVSRFDGQFEYQFSADKAGVRIVTPMLAVETVAAGGGSVCAFDGQKLIVGPHSAGSHPGPACYGRGGPLTITDVNLFSGKIDPAHFPFPLHIEVIRRRLAEIDDQIAASGQSRLGERKLADGFTRLANQKMADAIRQVSAARGYDPAEHVLVGFGAAGAQHACAIARSLGIRSILLHPLAGLLSAWGIGMADVRRFAERTVGEAYSPKRVSLIESEFASMEERLSGEVLTEGIAPGDIELIRLLDLRYKGEESAITVRRPADGDYAATFHHLHHQFYGHSDPSRTVEIATLRVEAVGRRPKPHTATAAETPRKATPDHTVSVWFDAAPRLANVYHRDRLRPGDALGGPAIIVEPFSTIIIDPGWSARLTGNGDLLLNDTYEPKSRGLKSHAASTDRDPVRLELLSNQFAHIATQMGITLQRTSLSVNVKERLDFSCAVLDAAGDLLVNAPHIPVHLGAIGEAVKALLAHVPDLRPGDVYASNDPDLGGSHLPDVTVITPVFDAAGKQLLFFTASRAHHAEIGGVRPGSAYPFARCLNEEGIVLRNFLISRAGRFLESNLRVALSTGPYPSRSPDDNVADILAAVAANNSGSHELLRMIDQHSLNVVLAYARHIRDAAAEKARAALARFGNGRWQFADTLDDGSPLRVLITIHAGQLHIDFTGTGLVNANSLNANRAVVQSAVLYCLRCLIDEDIPLNAGVLSAVRLTIPEGCMLNPSANPDPMQHAAVVGGNVELSQKVVDVVLGALGLASASQGTMNNFVFGSDSPGRRFGYYETICGGSGAGPGFPGASAVHTHMTNTRITDVEVMERRYPVLVRRFSVRRNSGGEGQYPGGDGAIREIEFLAPVEVSLLTQRRTTQPFGLAGGHAGQAGLNLLRRAGRSSQESLGPLAQFTTAPGDVLTIHTPGGGGYGPPITR